eukprot:298344-Amphidinium_carterae.1
MFKEIHAFGSVVSSAHPKMISSFPVSALWAMSRLTCVEPPKRVYSRTSPLKSSHGGTQVSHSVPSGHQVRRRLTDTIAETCFERIQLTAP